MTMLELCMECRNFHKPDIYAGNYTISGGVIEPLPDIPDGAWIRIVGSTFNDGCWQYPAANLTDEEFRGAVWLMHVPPDFVILAGPYASESFAGYDYTKKTSIGDVPTTWNDPRLGFSRRLARWRKI